MGIPEGEEKEKGIENTFEEIMAENFTDIKETDIKIQEGERAPNKLNPNRHIPRHYDKNGKSWRSRRGAVVNESD